MAIDFFEMMKEEQKKASQEETPKEVEKPKKEEKTAEKVQETTKKAKGTSTLSFDEQYKAIKDPQLKMLVDYLLTLDGMKEKMNHPKVSINGMYQYCRNQAQKKAKNGFYFSLDNEELYGWGRHYYDEHGNVAE